MTKKDFEMLARCFASERAKCTNTAETYIVDSIIRKVASELLNTNSRFDTRQFCNASMGAPAKV